MTNEERLAAMEARLAEIERRIQKLPVPPNDDLEDDIYDSIFDNYGSVDE